MRASSRLLALAIAPLAAGCSLAPDYVRPAAPVPAILPPGATDATAQATLPDVSYTDLFRDPRLLQLISLALANNRDLRIAAANIAQARAQVRVTRSAQFPDVAIGASANGTTQPGRIGQAYALQGAVASYEVDLFGRLANATAADRERALASEAARDSVRIGLVADIASAWATYAADQDLRNVALETADNARRSVELTRARLRGGIAPRTDLRQAEQVLATAEGDLARQDAALAEDVNLLQLLVGSPFDTALLPGGLAQIADTIATLPAGTSSEVLLRRPDVRQAEFELRAAYADIGVARAALFPRLSLNGLVGLAGNTIGLLFTGGALGVSGGVGLTQGIFDAGGRRAGVAVSEARRDAVLAAYERAIQIAFREVADALATQRTIRDQVDAARRNTAAAADTAQLTEERYRGGIESFLANLVTQRALYQAQREEVAILLISLQNRFELYRTLGSDAELAPFQQPAGSQSGQGAPDPIR